MKVLIGNKIINIEKSEFEYIARQYKSIVIDLGTGNGQFVYRNAKSDSQNFYIGIDPCADSMMEYSLKAARKACKGGVKNVLFIIEAVENLPGDLDSIADKIHINLPWGTLRDGIVKGEERILSSIRKISKDKCRLEIYITYNNLYEGKEVDSRNLPELSVEFIKKILKSRYSTQGINITEVASMNNEALKTLETRWAKKLAFGRTREIFHFKCSVVK